MARTKTSKRKNCGESDKIHEKKRRTDSKDVQAESVLFHEVLLSAGLSLMDDQPNEIRVDITEFQKKVEQSLTNHVLNPKIAEMFVEGLAMCVENPVRLRWCLLPSVVPQDSSVSSQHGTSDSLIKLLLGVETIQMKLIEMLLEKVVELSDDEVDSMNLNLTSLILGQLRWLDRICDCKVLVDKMFDIISVTTLTVQREIINCLPDVIEDVQHMEVADKLRELFLENNSLMVAVLEAFSNMTLHHDMLKQVRSSVLQALSSVALCDLPIIVKFLMQTVNTTDVFEVVQSMRTELDLTSSVVTKDTLDRKAKMVESTAVTLTFDAIQSTVRFQKFVADAWLKVIESVKSASEHKPLDIIMLLVLHSDTYKKTTEALFKKKILAGRFSTLLLSSTFASYDVVMHRYFHAYIAIAGILLCSNEPCILQFACSMYINGFSVFDTFCQQEIISCLLTHIGSGFESEVDTSLDILLKLVHGYNEKMSQFTVYVKGVLDYMDKLSLQQINKLYDLLSKLAYSSPSAEGQMTDELHILIRKQLTHSNSRYQKMGVLGANMVIQSISAAKRKSMSESQMSQEDYDYVVGLLQLVKTSCLKISENAALFMDQLSCVINSGTIHKKVEAWIADNVTSDFQDDFVVDIEPVNRDRELPSNYSLLYGLDKDVESSIAINLYPLVENSYNSRYKRNFQIDTKYLPICLAPCFRLLQICESRQNNGILDGIDALLGCPLYTVDINSMQNHNRRGMEVHVECIFFTINWFIELLNAFSGVDDPEVKNKLSSRLKSITDLITALRTYLPENYMLPPANFDMDDIDDHRLTKELIGNKKSKPSGKSENSLKGDAELDDRNDVTLIDKSYVNIDFKQCDSLSNMESYLSYFRELDLSVFEMMKAQLIFEMTPEGTIMLEDCLKIQPVQLEFLLSNLVKKTEKVLVGSKQKSYLKKANVKKMGMNQLYGLSDVSLCHRVVQLMPAICQHLESIHNYFQNMSADDYKSRPASDSPAVESCYCLLLQLMLNVLSWNGFDLHDSSALKKEVLINFAQRINIDIDSSSSVIRIGEEAFNYVDKLSSSVPTLTCAVMLCKLLQVTAGDSAHLQQKLGSVSHSMLMKEWLEVREPSKGSKVNEQLSVLIKLYLECSTDSLACMEEIAAVAIPQLMQSGKNGFSEKYPSLTRSSYAVFYKRMLSNLVVVSKNLLPNKFSEPEDAKMNAVYVWNVAVRVFHILTSLIKSFDSRSNIGSLLKHGRSFMDIFLRNGMPLLDEIFRKHTEDVQSLLKNLQLSTRALQHLCGHSKILCDVSLTNQVPLMKKTLETFVYRVKAMLTINKCMEAFWLGNLKNRDIQGEEILSQNTTVDRNSQVGDAHSSKADTSCQANCVTTEEPCSDSEDESYSETF